MHVVDRRVFEYPPEAHLADDPRLGRTLRDSKVRIALDDGHIIEAAVFCVRSETGIERHACVSTQAGCKFGCVFCTSGRNAFVRDLTTREILREIEILRSEDPAGQLDHVMYMGTGEPLDNYENVVDSIAAMQAGEVRFKGSVGLATCGLADRIIQLADCSIDLSILWVSLHAPTNEKRKQVMPVTELYPVEEVISAAHDFSQGTNTSVWLNYLLYLGFNDTSEDIESLVGLLAGRDHLGLMLTTPNRDLASYARAGPRDLARFGHRIRARGLRNDVTFFSPLGGTVGARCGEFAFAPRQRSRT